MNLNGDLEVLQKIVDGALASLEASRQRIDDLNVYPVPDGDTGTNLTMTVRAVSEAVEQTSAASRQSLARDIARGALMGARGNSGVIFSQIVRGAADVLGETDGPRIDANAAALALRGASDAAYRAVRRPVEGTMLSVIRELAEEAEARALEGPCPRRSPHRARPPRRDRGRADAGAAAGAPRRRRRRRRRRGTARARARRRRDRERRAAADASAARRAAQLRSRPPGAVAVPLLHRLPRRGARPRP